MPDGEESGHQPMSSRIAARATGAKRLRFKHAALAYLVYGIVYEGWAVYALYARGLPVRGLEYAFLGVGLALLMAFPWLLYQGHVWFARLLSALVAMRILAVVSVLSGVGAPNLARRALGGITRQESPELLYVVALAVSLVTLFFIVRAAWYFQEGRPRARTPDPF